ncbi:hypothetical protein GX48_05010 [Paracoccidioides brasiliensis]|nr:hypothetical protein GX48_05010 [Paracoccidioides brasiliensis]
MRGPSPRLSRRMIHKADPPGKIPVSEHTHGSDQPGQASLVKFMLGQPGLPYGSVQVIRVEEAQLEKLADAREWDPKSGVMIVRRAK